MVSADPVRIYAVLSLLVNFCLRAFRRGVFESIQSAILPDSRKAALAGSLPLSGPALEKNVDPAHLPLYVPQRSTRKACGIAYIIEYFWELQIGHPQDLAAPKGDPDSEPDESQNVHQSRQQTAQAIKGNETSRTLFNLC